MSFDIFNFVQTAPIKLVSGIGSPDTGGCWMAAISVYSGDSWSDHPDCVCPIIRQLCISINDSISSDEARGRIIGPVLLLPVGTATDDKSVNDARRWHLIDAAVRRFAPHALRSAGLADEADSLEGLPEVTAANAANAARAAANAANAANAASAAANAAYAADAAARAAARAAADAAARAAAAADADAAARAAAATAAADARDKFIAQVAIPVIVELCNIGSRVTVEPSCEELAIRRSVQCVDC